MHALQDGLEMFGGEVLLAEVSGKPNQVEIIWDELREEWFGVISRALIDKYVF